MRYYALKNDFKNKGERYRITKRLVALKKDLAIKVPQKLFNENILIATWNIRDFDSNKYGHGPRLKESFYYLAETISAYDLVALQEVNDNLYGFKKLMYILGPDWDYIMTDVSGNSERMVFVYDTKRVDFKKLAGEIVLGNKNLVNDNLQFARTPFIVSFQSGWFSFKLCTVHIYYGSASESSDAMARRVDEIDKLAKAMVKRAKKYDENLILLGDFNIVSPEHKTMEALEDGGKGFTIPEPLKKKPVYTNMKQTMYYDQIAYRERKGEVVLGDGENSAGAYNYFNKVFTTRQWDDYKKDILANVNGRIAQKKAAKARARSQKSKDELQGQIENLQELIATDESIKKYYKDEWRTFQMSDHLPMWTELKINFSISYLKKIHEEVERVED